MSQTASLPTPPVRGYDFTAHSTTQPTQPQPGDRLDAEFDRTNGALAAAIGVLALHFDAGGNLKAGSVTYDKLAPATLQRIKAEITPSLASDVTAAQTAAQQALQSATDAAGAAALAASRATAAGGSATQADTARTTAQQAASAANASAQATTASATDAGNSANHALDSANRAKKDQELASAWAEWLDGGNPIPPNFFAHTAITGNHWSARWWATEAQRIVTSITITQDDIDKIIAAAAAANNVLKQLRGFYYGALPADPTTDPNGDPPTSGDFYLNTTINGLRFFTGSIWHDTAAVDLMAFLARAGGTMTGALVLAGEPQQPLEAAPKSYVDSAATTLRNRIDVLDQTVQSAQAVIDAHTQDQNNPHGVTAAQVGALPTAGGAMKGPLTLAGAPTADDQAATKLYVDNVASRAVDQPARDAAAAAQAAADAAKAKADAALTPAAGDQRYLRLSGGTMTGAVRALGGTAAAPGILFTGANTSGIYAGGGNSIGIGVDGTERLKIEGNAVTANTGRLFVHGVGGGALLHLDKRGGNEGSSNRVLGRVATSNRWTLDMGDSANEVGGDAGSNFVLTRYNDSGASLGFVMTALRQTGQVSFYSVPNNGATGVSLTPGATAWASLSDEREKNITGPVENGVATIVNLRPIRYRYKHDPADAPERIGFGAQTTRPTVPQAVSEMTNAAGETRLTLAPTELIPHLVAAVQELAAEIAVLKARAGAAAP